MTMDPVAIDERVRVPSSALSVTATRASGPGGQNVNKVSSKIVLRVDLGLVEGLTDEARRRLSHLARRRDRDGRWLVTSQRTRDQGRNLADTLSKVRTAILAALRPPRARRATRPSAASVSRRLEAKRRAGEKKRRRATKAADGD